MPARVWKTVVSLIVLLLVAVVGLDQWQARRGAPSLFKLSWLFEPSGAAARRGLGESFEPGGAAARRGSSQARRPPSVEVSAVQSRPSGSTPPHTGLPSSGALRVAVLVDDLGSRRDVFELVKELRRPVSVAVLPELPLSGWIAREAARSGMEVLLDLPMEPYRFPELDPGPGALTMAMPREEVQRTLGKHLAALPPVVGVITHMGSRMTEDRERMRVVLEVLAAKRLFLVDALTSNLSIAYDEAKQLGMRAGRRQVVVDHSEGEAGDRLKWEEVARWAARRGDVIVVAHGHPLTVRLLKEYIPRWEARGIRLVPVSQISH